MMRETSDRQSGMCDARNPRAPELRLHRIFLTSHDACDPERPGACIAAGKFKRAKLLAWRRASCCRREATSKIGGLICAALNLRHDTPLSKRKYNTPASPMVVRSDGDEFSGFLFG